MEVRMDGRGALVTGASLGIGFAIASAFAGAGANVAIVARRDDVLADAAAKIAETAQGEVVPVAGDVSRAEDCARVFEAARAALGRIDVLVNNAGSSARGPFADITDEAWQADLDLKLFAAIRLCRLALPEMAERRWGRVINVLNTGAKAPGAQGAPTAVTRAAGMALTKAMASEYAALNVLINSLHVGRIESDQWVRRHAEAQATDGDNRPLADFYADMGKALPMGRFGTAEEFANVACFLASDLGSYVTGAAINVDGGMCPVP